MANMLYVSWLHSSTVRLQAQSLRSEGASVQHLGSAGCGFVGTAMRLLLKGPDASIAAEKNCQTLIPKGTKLLGIKISNGVAYLDFSEDFEINTFGVEGYNAQLMQIVYTATSFSTVKSVQFLIEGEKKEYLGSEGQWIGSPLSRNAF